MCSEKKDCDARRERPRGDTSVGRSHQYVAIRVQEGVALAGNMTVWFLNWEN